MDKLSDYLLSKVTDWIPKVILFSAVLLVFFILAWIVKRIIMSTVKRLNLDSSLALLLARAAGITLLLFGFITAFGTVGINVSALVAGLGLTGFALGFALKDTISNLLSGILILIYRPFVIGNRIKLAGYEGEVAAIDLRYTELNAEGLKILIPNAKLFTDPITVLTQKSNNQVGKNI